jgi:hypothetical protein
VGRLIVVYCCSMLVLSLYVFVTLHNLCTLYYVYYILEDIRFVATVVHSFGLGRIT